ncbi:MAG TPA: amidohydrolase family protein [Candidatus Polarisedimenticolaceae bacterium]|nr:amidohydrolase family protein [Candidatus Polarisedimenticolaceae bacterium]
MAIDDDSIDRLARRLAGPGVWSSPTLVVKTALPRALARSADPLEADPHVGLLHPMIRRFWSAAVERASGRDRRELLAESEAAHDSRLKLLRAIDRHGGRLLVGTDAPNPFVAPGFSIHHELQFFVDTGLPRPRVLEIATAEAAAFLDRAGEFGVIAPGTRGDLLVLDGDPRQDLAALERPVGVMAAGRWYDRRSLEAEIERTRPQYLEGRPPR